MIANSGAARLVYDVTGGEGGADVLLLHAGVADRRSWRHVLERLTPRHRCVAYDARGYGETTYEREDGWSPVADAVAVLDAAGVERAVLVAGSLGAKTAIDLALAHPERVSALGLIGADVSGAPDLAPGSGPTVELHRRLTAAETLEETERLEAWMWLDGPGAPEGRVGGRTRELFLEMNGRALRAPDPGEPADVAPAWPRLGELAVPVLLLVGRLDHEEVVAIGEAAAELIPDAELELLDGVAHLPYLEGDTRTLDELEAFVNAEAPVDRFVAATWEERAEEAERLAATVDPGATSTDGTTPLYAAAVSGLTGAVARLLERGADPNRMSEGEGEGTPLCAAACWGHDETVAALLAAGADPDLHEDETSYPLLYAAFGMYPRVTERLLAAGADPNAHPNPLTVATERGSLEVVRLLLDAGADPAAPGPDGRTALEVAELWSGVDIEAELREGFPPGAELKVHRERRPEGTEAIEITVHTPDGNVLQARRETGHARIAALLRR